MTPLQTALWIVLGVALVISVVTDIASQRILDLITYPTIAIALVIRFFDQGIGNLETGVISGIVCALGACALFAIAALRGSMGWGDVKLMAAVGAVTGWPLVMYAVTCITLAGAVQAMVTLMWKGKVWDATAAVLRSAGQRLRLLPKDQKPAPREHIPYGVAIALGTWWAMWWQYPADNLVR